MFNEFYCLFTRFLYFEKVYFPRPTKTGSLHSSLTSEYGMIDRSSITGHTHTSFRRGRGFMNLISSCSSSWKFCRIWKKKTKTKKKQVIYVFSINLKFNFGTQISNNTPKTYVEHFTMISRYFLAELLPQCQTNLEWLVICTFLKRNKINVICRNKLILVYTRISKKLPFHKVLKLYSLYFIDVA